MYVFRGTLPNSVEVARDTASAPAYIDLGAYLEIYSPHSRINFSTGIEYSQLSIVLENKASDLRDPLTINQLQVPFNMRLVLGKKFARANPMLLFGGSYNLPYAFDNKDFFKGKKALVPTYNLHAAGGVQLNFRGRQKKEYIIKLSDKNLPTVWGRFWIYAKVIYAPTNILNVESSAILFRNGAAQSFEITDLKFVIGAKAFLGSKKKYSL